MLLSEWLWIDNEFQIKVLLLVIHEIWKPLAKFNLQAIFLIYKSYFEASLIDSKHSQNKLSRLILSIVDHHWVLLVDCVLVACWWWHFAPLIVQEVGIYHDIHGVHDDLRSWLTIHTIFEVNHLLNIHLAFNRVLLHLIVNYMVFYVFVLEIKWKTATFALAFGLYLNGASLMKGTALNVAEIFFVCICKDLNFLISRCQL